jgi:SAM-dependent methyltransferase
MRLNVVSFFTEEVATALAVGRPQVEWEQGNCPLCDSSRWAVLVEAPDLAPGGSGLWFAVVQCQSCGLCFTNPRPRPSTMSRFYPPAYAPHQPPSPRGRPSWWRRLPLRARRRRGERHVLPLQGRGRLLDFGCGSGSFLDRMKCQGWQVTGVDMAAAAQQAGSDLGMRVLAGSLPHPELTPGAFDVITMWHSLEHVHDPLTILREAERLLVPGGKLLVAVPNIDSAAFRWCGAAWVGLDLPRHLIHFTPHTLRLMLEHAGFAVEQVRMVRHSSWLRLSAQRACRHFRGTFWQRLLQRRPLARLATWTSYLTGQADCLLATAKAVK